MAKAHFTSASPAVVERLLSRRFIAPGGCWEWQGAIGPQGYGSIKMPMGDGTWRARRVHRVAYAAFVSDVPAERFVCHRCDNRKCFNPAHLFLGSAYDNTHDGIRKGRIDPHRAAALTHCRNGHEYTHQNTVFAAAGYRNCLTCRADNIALAHERRAARYKSDIEYRELIKSRAAAYRRRKVVLAHS